MFEEEGDTVPDEAVDFDFLKSPMLPFCSYPMSLFVDTFLLDPFCLPSVSQRGVWRFLFLDCLCWWMGVPRWL